MYPHYANPLPLGDPDGLPYSKGLMARSLVAAGVSLESAYVIAGQLELDLFSTGSRAADPDRLNEVAAEVLGEAEGVRVVLHLRRLAALRTLDVPIVLLVGGATGTGKSTVATDSAHRLGITRVTSTDFIRQTIRAYFPSSKMPSVHVSSFEAGSADGLEAGFIDQTRRVLVGVEASLERAMTEGWSMAIEGALLVHAVLLVESVEVHRSHFVVRDRATGGTRALGKYLDGFTEIRRLQEVIVERAQREGVPVIESSSIERATTELLDLVLARAESLAPTV